MNLPAIQPAFDSYAYLAWEAEQPHKHEYLAGEVFAMAGASDAHVTLAGNCYMLLRQHLRGGPCSVFISDMKLRVAQDDAFFYPDVLVSCDAADREQSHYKTAPLLVIEVLSPSTAAYDRSSKFAAYRKLPSLREYCLIDSERLGVDVFRREGDARDLQPWSYLPYDAADQQVELASVGLRVPLSALYEDVRLALPTVPAPGKPLTPEQIQGK